MKQKVAIKYNYRVDTSRHNNQINWAHYIQVDSVSTHTDTDKLAT